jgi:hypothetical protein
VNRESPDRSLLLPIRIDDAVLRTTEPWAVTMRGSVHIGDFQSWEDDEHYRPAFDRLVVELLASRRSDA